MIVFAWTGFPQYAARCVGAFVHAINEEVKVIATHPGVPIKGMDRLCGCPVVWTDGKSSLLEHAKNVRVLFVSGWCEPRFNELEKVVRANGGKVIALIDNNYEFSIRGVIKAVAFRFLRRKCYDGYFVPGASGRKLLRFYGVPNGKIVEGMYTADESLFRGEQPLSQRPKKLIYVGQFIPRKNVLNMCEAFIAAVSHTGADGWEFNLYGSGVLQPQLEALAAKLNAQLEKNHCKICVNPFMQPEELAARYRESRIFVLPSFEEHWGVVVHEAALSGCLLLLSKEIGAGADFIGATNGLRFAAGDLDGMTNAFMKALSMSNEKYDAAYAESIALASKNGLKGFVTGVNSFLTI